MVSAVFSQHLFIDKLNRLTKPINIKKEKQLEERRDEDFY